MKTWFKYIRPYWMYFLITPLCMLVEVAGEVIMPKLLGTVIDSQMDGTLTVAKGLLVMGGIILCAVLMMAGGVGGSYFGAKASVNFAADLRQDVLKGADLLVCQYRQVLHRFAGNKAYKRRYPDAELYKYAFKDGFPRTGYAHRCTYHVDKPSAKAFGYICGFNTGSSGIGRSYYPHRIFAVRSGSEKLDALNSTVQENVTNVRVVKSFVREDHEIDKFGNANREYKRASMSAMRIMIFMSPVTTLIMNVTVLCIIYFGSRMVFDTAGIGMGVGDLQMFVTYTNQILFSLMMVSMLLMMSSRALASAKRIKEYSTSSPTSAITRPPTPSLPLRTAKSSLKTSHSVTTRTQTKACLIIST